MQDMYNVSELNNINVDVTPSPEKPFNECLTCPHLRNGCSGPNLMVMEMDRLWEFLELMRARLGYSYDRISRITGISPTNVKKNMTGQVKDPSYHTIREIAKALVGDPTGKHPCALYKVEGLNSGEDVENIMRENKQLRNELIEERVRKEFILEDWRFKRDQMISQNKTIATMQKIILKYMGEDNEV